MAAPRHPRDLARGAALAEIERLIAATPAMPLEGVRVKVELLVELAESDNGLDALAIRGVAEDLERQSLDRG